MSKTEELSELIDQWAHEHETASPAIQSLSVLWSDEIMVSCEWRTTVETVRLKALRPESIDKPWKIINYDIKKHGIRTAADKPSH